MTTSPLSLDYLPPPPLDYLPPPSLDYLPPPRADVFSSPPGFPATAFTTNDDLQGSIAAFCSAAASY